MGGGGGQGGCEQRIDVFGKIHKKKNSGGRGGSRFVGGGQGGSEQRIEAFVKVQKKIWGGGGVRVELSKELRFLGKFTKKKKIRGGGGGGGSRFVWGGGVRVGGGGSEWM